jgi:hypothetical protein
LKGFYNPRLNLSELVRFPKKHIPYQQTVGPENLFSFDNIEIDRADIPYPAMNIRMCLTFRIAGAADVSETMAW